MPAAWRHKTGHYIKRICTNVVKGANFALLSPSEYGIGTVTVYNTCSTNVMSTLHLFLPLVK